MTATSPYLNRPVSSEREAQLEAENRRLKNACAGALERLSRVPIPSAFPRMGDALAVSGAIAVLRDALSTTASRGGDDEQP